MESHGKNRPITVQLKLNGQQVLMQVDTGAAVSIIAEATQQKLFPDAHPEQSPVQLQTYTAESLAVLGTIEVQVKYGNCVGKQVLFAVSWNGPTLLGYDWLMAIRLNWQSLGVATVQNTSLTLKSVLDKYSDVFKKELGTLKGFKAKLTLKPDSKPQLCRPRQVPYALKDAVDRELQHLENFRVIERIPHSKWGTSLVAVPKGDDSLRLCGDYRKTVNPAIEIDQYPLPHPEDLMAALTGGHKFSNLDLSAAYQQMILDEDSHPYVVINTQKG